MNQSPHPCVDVSVVIPTHNRPSKLQGAIASVTTQTGVRWELIVVDDGSRDETAALLRSQISSRVRVFRFDRNVERCRARNQGLAMAQGETILFLDDDDSLRPNALSTLYGALRDLPTAVAAAGARWEVFEGEAYERRSAHPRHRICRPITKELLFGWSAVPSQSLFRTRIVRQVGAFEHKSIVCEDRDLWLKVVNHGDVALIPDTVATYLYHPDQYRPPHLLRLRTRIALKAVHGFPVNRRMVAKRIIRSGRCIDYAEIALTHGHPLTAGRLNLGVTGAHPQSLLFAADR